MIYFNDSIVLPLDENSSESINNYILAIRALYDWCKYLQQQTGLIPMVMMGRTVLGRCEVSYSTSPNLDISIDKCLVEINNNIFLIDGKLSLSGVDASINPTNADIIFIGRVFDSSHLQ